MKDLLPIGPVLTTPRLGALPRAAGRYLEQVLFTPVAWSQRWRYEELDITTAIYLISDAEHRLRWLGQVNRTDGLLERLARHDSTPAKRAVFAKVRVIRLAEYTPPHALDAIEGRCADVLRIRETMRPRVWRPRVTGSRSPRSTSGADPHRRIRPLHGGTATQDQDAI